MKNKNEMDICKSTIQRLLYEKPLYNYIKNGNVNVLVFGFTYMCQKFVDLAFELSQVNGYKLNITVVSDDENAKETYLNARPVFENFFDVDEKIVENSYGKLSFIVIDNNDDDDNIASRFLDEGQNYSYIFIDYGSDMENYSRAKACNDYREILDSNYVINCVCSKPRKTHKNIDIVLKNNTLETHKDYTKLKRMAFNCHLLWNSSNFMDMRKLRKEFNTNYNFSSSLSNILSIKYKLNSIGIDVDDIDAVQKFIQLVNSADNNDKNKISSLVKAEHDRWNVSLICEGWSTQTDLTKCLNGIKDKKRKLHPCLVHCDDKIVLESSWKGNNYIKWNTADEREIAKLDSLDRVSVNLHMIFKSKADEIKSGGSLFGGDIYEIQKLLSTDEQAEAAFSKYFLCLESIINGSYSQVKQYQHYKDRLIKSLKNIKASTAVSVTKRISIIEDKIAPIIESEKYTDYKAFDTLFIKNIPFILTYKSNIHLGIPLEINNDDGENQILFRNVAPSLFIKPSRITYFYDYNESFTEKLEKALQYVCKCMQSHNLQTNINICLLSQNKVRESAIEKLSNLSNRIHRIDIINYENEADLKTKISDFVKLRRFTAIERNNSSTSSTLKGKEVYESNPYYVFDSKKPEIICYGNCDVLKYIPFKASLKISDLFESKNSSNNSSLPDLQLDYEYFWRIYRNNESVWKCLCNALAQTDITENQIKIEIPKKENTFCEKSYYVENIYIDSLKNILSKLCNDETDFSYEIKFHSNSVHKVIVNAPNKVHGKITKILSNPYLLSNCFDVKTDKDGRSVIVFVSNLMVGKLYEKTILENAFSLNNPFDEVKKILDKLCEDNYILNYVLNKTENSDEKYISFCYSSHQLKDLMTSAGKILELYVYYRLMKIHSIDEIATGVQVKRNGSGVENELDVVFTSGFRSFIIECKAQNKLKQDFYYKLNYLNKTFGINSTAVLIADLDEKERWDNSAGDMQRARGDEAGVVTLYSFEPKAKNGEQKNGKNKKLWTYNLEDNFEEIDQLVKKLLLKIN